MFGYNVLAENEATLKNVKVNNIECSCVAFNCTVEVDASKATITYELNDSEATVDRLSGFSVDLISPTTTMKVTVTNSKGTEKIENIYNIVINKHEKSNDVSLKEFGINDENIALSEDVFVYSFTAKYDAEVLNIKMVPNDNNAKVLSNLEQAFPLDKSSLAIDLEVKAENGDTKTYRVVVYRGLKPDTSLKTLKIADKEVKLISDKLEYDFQVDYSIIDLPIEVEANSKDAKVEIQKEDLVVGQNEVKVIVTNQNAKSEYLLNVVREENTDKSIANLKKLTISEYSKLNFDENVLDYKLKFNEIPEKLTIKATPVSSDAKVEILYNEDLSNEDKILIRVSVEKITREYVLTVIKEENVEEDKTFILISLIGVILAIIILFILEITDKKRKRKSEIIRLFELRKKKEREKAKGKIKDIIKEKEKVIKSKVIKEKKPKEVKKDDDIEII